MPVEGRLIHTITLNNIKKDTSTKSVNVEEPILQRYGLNENEVNYSVSRNELNKMLLTECKMRKVDVIFNHELVDVDFDAMTATYKSLVTNQK